MLNSTIMDNPVGKTNTPKPNVTKKWGLTLFEYRAEGQPLSIYIFDREQRLASSYDALPNGMHLASKHPGHIQIEAQQFFATAESAMKQCIEWAGGNLNDKIVMDPADFRPGTSDIPDIFKS